MLDYIFIFYIPSVPLPHPLSTALALLDFRPTNHSTFASPPTALATLCHSPTRITCAKTYFFLYISATPSPMTPIKRRNSN